MGTVQEAKEPTLTQERIAQEIIGLRRRLAELVAGTDDTAVLQENRHLADRYSDLIGSLPDVVVELDAAARITFISPRAFGAFGYRPEELIGRSFKALLYPDQDRDIDSIFNEILSAKTETFKELRACHKQGVEVWVRITVVTRPRSAILPAAVVILTDITERVKMARALFESEQKYRALFGGSPDSITILDLQGRILDGNQFYGFAPDAIKGKHFRDLNVLPAEYLEYSEVLLQELASGKRIGPIEIKIRNLEGEQRWIEVYASRIESDGKPFAIQVISRDITERKRLEEQLFQSEKMEAVGRLAGGMAHDFNNQLTVILNSAEMLRQTLSEDDSLLEKVNLIKLAAERSVNLTQQLLAFGRRQIVEPAVLDLNQLLIELRPMLSTALGERIALVFQLDETLEAVRIDPAQVQRIAINLVLNARDAMPEGGVVTVRTANQMVLQHDAAALASLAPGPYVTLSVADTGCGMDRETRSRAFEPFYTTKEPGKGTGLGLATVYGAIKQSGGEIRVKSQPGSGTVFTIYLPRVDGEPSVQKQPERRSGEVAQIERTVLLVEDDRNVRETTKLILEDGGFKVIGADSPEQGLRLYERYYREIDVVLSDVVMPGMSVKELIERMKDTDPEVKLLFISGYSEQVVIEHGVVDPTMHFLSKPFSIDQLLDKMAVLLQS